MANKEEKQFSVTLNLSRDSVALDSAYINNCYFIEDIFSYSIVGKLDFTDSQGILEFGPLTGNETLTISYGFDRDVEKTFDIYKIGNAHQISPGEANNLRIELFFVDPMYTLLNNYEYSISWKDKKIDEIIDNISKNMLEVQNFNKFEKTQETLDFFYSPYWKPLELINWLMKRASGSFSKQSGYVFFNNTANTDKPGRENNCNFVTLEKLLQQEELIQLNNEDEGKYIFQSEGTSFYNKILDMYISLIDKMGLKDLKGGMRFGYDFKRKKFLTGKYNYKKAKSNYTMHGKYTLFEDISDESTHHIFEGETDQALLDNIFYNDWIKRYCNQLLVSIIVSGHERRYAGGVIDVVWPSADAVNEKFNKNLQGKYLVKSVTHQFSGAQNPQYKQKLNLIKTAYHESIASELSKVDKQNKSTIKKLGR